MFDEALIGQLRAEVGRLQAENVALRKGMEKLRKKLATWNANATWAVKVLNERALTGRRTK